LPQHCLFSDTRASAIVNAISTEGAPFRWASFKRGLSNPTTNPGCSMARAIASGGMPTHPFFGQSDLLSAWGDFTVDMLAAGSESLGD